MTPVTRNRWILAGCSAAMFAVLAFLTSMALRAEKMERKAQADRDYQEAIRQALWRMDSALTPILVQEAARPAEEYKAVYANPRITSRSKKLSPATNEAPREFSPLLGMKSDWIRLHFYVDLSLHISSGESTSLTTLVCSPQAPMPGPISEEEADEAANAFPDEVKVARSHLQELQTLLDNSQIRDQLGLHLAKAMTNKKLGHNSALTQIAPSQQNQQQKSEAEYQTRQSNLSRAQQALSNVQAPPPADLEPIWILPPLSEEPELFLLRTRDTQTLFQGIWFDWQQLNKWLCQSTADIFPAAQLRPLGEGESPSPGLMLASIPAVLDPGPWTGSNARTFPAIWWLIAGAWAVMIGAFTMLRIALSSATELSERRGRFVSAVTHELRTPLTTFQLYSQMLADGMVTDEKSRAEYLTTLKAESERLARIVDNVLLYARVEGKRTALHRESIAAGALLARLAPALERRAQEAGMRLEIDEGGAAKAMLHTDPQIVEQILFNLADNSCKYARGAADRRIQIALRAQGKQLEILVCDFGPGIPPQERGKLFEPFQRGEAHVAGSVPGIGLGLSLSRALARDLGGELTLLSRADAGACFALHLPLEFS